MSAERHLDENAKQTVRVESPEGAKSLLKKEAYLAALRSKN